MGKKQEVDLEAHVVAEMSRAQQIAEQLFGTTWNTYAVEELYDYLQASEDEEEFASDLKKAIEHAKAIYKTAAPTPEQAFGVFVNIHGDDE